MVGWFAAMSWLASATPPPGLSDHTIVVDANWVADPVAIPGATLYRNPETQVAKVLVGSVPFPRGTSGPTHMARMFLKLHHRTFGLPASLEGLRLYAAWEEEHDVYRVVFGQEYRTWPASGFVSVEVGPGNQVIYVGNAYASNLSTAGGPPALTDLEALGAARQVLREHNPGREPVFYYSWRTARVLYAQEGQPAHWVWLVRGENPVGIAPTQSRPCLAVVNGQTGEVLFLSAVFRSSGSDWVQAAIGDETAFQLDRYPWSWLRSGSFERDSTWEEEVALDGRVVTAVRDCETNAVRHVYPWPSRDLGPRQTGDPETIARRFLRMHPGLFGAPQIGETLGTLQVDAGRVVFERRARGVPVEGNQLRVLLRQGRVTGVHWDEASWPGSVRPAITADAAREVARQTLVAHTLAAHDIADPSVLVTVPPKLVVVAGSGGRPAYLAWRLELNVAYYGWIVWVDARRGEIREMWQPMPIG